MSLFNHIFPKLRGCLGAPKVFVVIDVRDRALANDIVSRLDFYIPALDKTNLVFVPELPWRHLISGDIVLSFRRQHLFVEKLLRRLPNCFAVDHTRFIAGWEWCRLANYYSDYRVDIFAARKKFDRFVYTLRKENLGRSYIFGTGPSLSQTIGKTFADGYRLVCNTIVRDKALFSTLNPHAIVAGDAVYHFSDTPFANAFRKDLKERLRETNVVFIYPALFDIIVQREFSDFSERLIPIPAGKQKKVSKDLSSHFYLPALGNVLPLLLLPLACSLTREIFLWGFDGRSPDDKENFFWANSAAHSYPELMATLTASFPYFFEYFVPNKNSQNYISSVHGDTLEKCLVEAEADSYTIEMMHPSWTPTLWSRYKGGLSREAYYFGSEQSAEDGSGASPTLPNEE